MIVQLEQRTKLRGEKLARKQGIRSTRTSPWSGAYGRYQTTARPLEQEIAPHLRPHWETIDPRVTLPGEHVDVAASNLEEIELETNS